MLWISSIANDKDDDEDTGMPDEEDPTFGSDGSEISECELTVANEDEDEDEDEDDDDAADDIEDDNIADEGIVLGTYSLLL